MLENLDKDQWCYKPESINKLQHHAEKPSLTGQKRFFSLNWYQTLKYAGGKKKCVQSRAGQISLFSITRLVTCSTAKRTGRTSALTGLALCKWRLKDQAKKKIRVSAKRSLFHCKQERHQQQLHLLFDWKSQTKIL